MCFYSQQTKSATELENRFNARFKNSEQYRSGIYNGFEYPQTPVITNTEQHTIQLFQWGLIPAWAKDDSIQKSTLNGRMETIHEKPSFRNISTQRCLILSDGFYEWKWLDEKGKQKQKYFVHLPDKKSFAFAGLWSDWVNRETGEIISTYTILTTEANALMSEIHNTKKRMPVIVSPENETAWLVGKELQMYNDMLLATAV